MRAPLRYALALFALTTLPSLAVACSGSNDSQVCTQSESAALHVCGTAATPLKGIDVSFYQGTVDWAAVKKSGVAFGIARISDGLKYQDETFELNWKNLKKEGLVRGAYQFFRPAQDPVQQADLFVKMVNDAGGFAPGDIPPIVDVEAVDGVGATTFRKNLQTWLDAVAKATGIKPMIYTAQFMSPSIGVGFSEYPLWVANYGQTCPTLPDGWTKWVMWQTAEHGSVPGVDGTDVDLDVFDGTLADLLTFTGANAHDGGANDGGPVEGTHPTDEAGTGPITEDAGATVGSGTPTPRPKPPSSKVNPCVPSR